MWELRNKLSRGRISLRSFSLLASTILLACFATIGPLARQAFAEDAIRQDENTITYQGKTFTHIDLNGDGKLDHLPPNLPAGTDGFINFTDPDKGPANLLLTQGSYKDTISFQYVSYEYKPINQFGKLLTTTPTTVNSTDAANHRSGSSSNCSNTETGAIGYIICPVTTFLAKSMDFIYRQIEDFFAVNTISADTNSSLHRMWSIVRDIANLCFVIAFLFVIFSQITNVGLSNHGIKAMLPRLIIAAILVNLSYVICAVAVDTSNILGSHLHGLFHSVLQQLNTGTQYDNTSTPSSYYLSYWEKFALAVLGGAGTVVTVYGAAVAVNAGTLALLLPILAGAILSALVAFLILAARQALIVILVIISPLAFVAYILPNTEKYFDKWKDGFMTLLLLFPIFSIVFSGAQLAGLVIIQNAHDNIITVLLGMAVQVAPLFITPLLLKFSGGILNRVAGIVNNPNKGLVDRTRNLANGLYQQRKNQVLGKKTFLDKKLGKEGTYKGRGNKLMRRAYKGYNAGITAPLRGASDYQANVKARRALYEAAAKNSHDDTKKAMDIQNDMDKESTRTSEITNRRLDTFTGQQIAHRQKDAEREKSRISNIHQATWDEATLTDANQKSLDLRMQESQSRAELAKGNLDKMHAEVLADGSESDHVVNLRGRLNSSDYEHMLTVARNIKTETTKAAFAESAKRMADEKLSEFKTDALKNNVIKVAGGTDIYKIEGKTIRKYAAGIGDEANVFADAIAKSRKDFGEQANAQRELAAHFKVSSSQMAKLSMGKEDVIVGDDSGNTYTFSKDNEYVRDMAAEEIFSVGSHNDKMRVIESTGAQFDADGKVIPGTEGENYAYRRTVMQAAIKSGFSKSAPAINDKTLEDINNGRFTGTPSWQYHSLREIFEGRLSSMSLSTANVNSLKMLFADTHSDPIAKAQYEKLINDAVTAKLSADPSADPETTRTSIESRFAKRRDELRRMAAQVLDTPTIRQNANDESVDELKKFAGNYYKEEE